MIIERLTEDMKAAMKSGDKLRLSTIRMLMSELKNAKIARGEDLTEADEQKVVASYAKKRKESIDTYIKGGRQDMADKEQAEFDITVSYLPEQMSDAELKAVVKKHIDAADGAPALGQVIKAVMAEVGSQADGKSISSMVKEMLG
ncbi:MAG: GatB/YqeY domain-containing protein [Candidatus Krumholzibacteria bacterium]|nr:GatB/YqeY domain-containing protein [Candidatus Krumholzibacteria bacterium]